MLLSRLLKYKFSAQLYQHTHQLTWNAYLVEILQKSAVEHLTIFRQLEVRDFGSVVTIVTTDFEALYAYKRGDYQQCLQLSTQNVHTLMYAIRMAHFHAFPGDIQLLDDDFVSLIALTLIVHPNGQFKRTNFRYDSSLS